MKKIRNKGITLIALVITIIILLILSGITISTLTQSGLFENAKKAEKEYKEKEKEELEMLDYLESSIINIETGKYVGGQFNEEKGVNTPKLIDGLIPVKINDDGTIEDVKSPNTDDSWYNYEDTSKTGVSNSKWANARTPDGSLFVWIPRYAYKIESRLHIGYNYARKNEC